MIERTKKPVLWAQEQVQLVAIGGWPVLAGCLLFLLLFSLDRLLLLLLVLLLLLLLLLYFGCSSSI